MKKRKKSRIRQWCLSKEDKKHLWVFRIEDRKFILEILRGLRNHSIDPMDYSPIADVPGKVAIRGAFSMPEETIETMMPTPVAQVKPLKEATPQEQNPFVDKKLFIEGEFTIVDKNNKEVPFRLNEVQEKYYAMLKQDHPNMEGIREIILKARQQGFSSLVLAMFAVDFITVPNSVSICIAHNKSDTEKLFRKVHHYIESYCKKNGFDTKEYLSMDTKSELENATNKAYFYIRTAGAKIGGRGGTALNVHYSEAAFFESTDKITATEIIEATNQQVPLNKGMIFLESTGGDYGTYFQLAWEKAVRGEINYKPRFFSWEELYSDEFIQKKRLEYQTEDKFLTDYPRTPEEAFLRTGSPFFDRNILLWMQKNTQREPIRSGRLAQDGELI